MQTRKISLTVIILTLAFNVFTQTVIGTISCDISKETFPFVEVELYIADNMVSKATSDIDGKFVFRRIFKGEYVLLTKYLGCKTDKTKLIINSDKIICNISLSCEKSVCNETFSNSEFTDFKDMNFDSISVREYVELLKIEKREKNYLHKIRFENNAKIDWIKKEDIPYLMTLVESEKDAKCVMSNYSSKLPIPNNSTLGGQVMNLIDSYRLKEAYPIFLTDCSKTETERVKEIKTWWEKIKK